MKFNNPPKSKKRFLFGVAGDIAKYQQWDPWSVRLLWLILAIISAGVANVVHLILAMIMPPANNFDINDYRVQ